MNPVLYLKNLFNSDWFFTSPDIPSQKALIILVSIFVMMILAAFLLKLYFGKKTKTIPLYQELKNRYFTLFLTSGIIGLVLEFFYFEAIPYLSMPFFFTILFLIFLIWLIIIVIYQLFGFKKQLHKYQQKMRLEKYLPAARRKR